MSNPNAVNEQELLDNAMASFLADVMASKTKRQQMRRNMECRRKLEQKWEAKRLARETCEYEFEYFH